MSEAVVADLMPLVLHAADDRLISRSASPMRKNVACAPRSFESVKERAAVVCGEGPSSNVSAMRRRGSWRGRDRNGPTILELESTA